MNEAGEEGEIKKDIAAGEVKGKKSVGRKLARFFAWMSPLGGAMVVYEIIKFVKKKKRIRKKIKR